MKLKPGGAERLRNKLASSSKLGVINQSLLDRMGTVHDLRFLIFDNNTRLLFDSTFDGDWDAYINDFADYIPNEIDIIFGQVEGFPGINSPNIKDAIVEHQVSSIFLQCLSKRICKRYMESNESQGRIRRAFGCRNQLMYIKT